MGGEIQAMADHLASGSTRSGAAHSHAGDRGRQGAGAAGSAVWAVRPYAVSGSDRNGKTGCRAMVCGRRCRRRRRKRISTNPVPIRRKVETSGVGAGPPTSKLWISTLPSKLLKFPKKILLMGVLLMMPK